MNLDSEDAPRGDGRYAIVVARFNLPVTEKLLGGAVDELHAAGVVDSRIDCFWTPGAMEIPHLCAKLQRAKKHDAIIALGAVIRGATPHFDYVAGECARGIMTLNLTAHAPVIFGVLTTDNADDALQRADPNQLNRGADAAKAAMRMVELTHQCAQQGL